MLLANDPIRDDDNRHDVLDRAVPPAVIPEDRTIGDTLKALVSDLHHLFRSEIALIRAQLGEKATGLASTAVGIAIGALLALVGLIVFVEGIAAVVALWLPAWAALLLTGAAVIMIGGLVSWLAVKGHATPAAPAGADPA